MNDPAMINPRNSEAGQLVQTGQRLPEVYQADVILPEPLFDFSTIRGFINRQFYLIIGTFLTVVLLGGIYSVLQKPLYTATAKVQVTPNGTMAFIPSTNGVVAPNQINDFIRTTAEVAKSRSFAKVVAEDLNLANRPGFLSDEIEAGRPANSNDEEWQKTKTNIAASILQRNIAVTPNRGTSILTLAYTSESPARAAEITNGYAEAFSLIDRRSDQEKNDYAKKFLEEQIETTRENLREAETAANLYARNAQLVSASAVDLGNGAVATVTGANLASINATFSQVRAERIRTEQRWRAVQDMDPSQLPEVQNNLSVQSLLAQRLTLQSELVTLRERYNEQFPEVADTRRKIEQLDNRILEIGQSVKTGIRNDFLVAQRQEAALQGELNQIKASALDEQDSQVQLDVLKRESEVAKSTLDVLLKQYNLVSATTNVDRGTIEIIDNALVPARPSSPKHLRNMLLAVFAGLGLAGGIALLREFADDSIRSITVVEDRVGLPVLGSTPSIKADGLDSAADNQFSELIEAYASIKSTVEFSIPRDSNVIHVTSSQAGEGKSTTSLILAELFARLGRRTLLIDADMRHPSIGSLIEEPANEMGFAEVLLGHAEMKDVLINSVHENLDILTMGNLPSNPVEVLSSREFTSFIEKQRSEYSMVIFDSPPVIGLADSPLISQRADATVFVIEANKVGLSQAKAAVKRLRSNGANLIGAVLTKFVPEKIGEGYGYGNDYYTYGKN